MTDDLELLFGMLINKFIEFKVGEDELIGKGLIFKSPEHILKFQKGREVLCKCEKRYITHFIVDWGLKSFEIVKLYRVSLTTLKIIMKESAAHQIRELDFHELD